MKRKVIDPSEILIGDDGTVRSDISQQSPWFRFIARMVDYTLLLFLLWGLRHLFASLYPVQKFESWIPLEYLIWIPIEAACLSAFGKTPGKWLLKIDIRQGRRERPDYLSALRRSFHVWLRGLGMGIPIVSVICLIVAYQRLKVLKITSWDKEDHFQISYRPISNMRLGLAALIAVGGVAFHIV